MKRRTRFSLFAIFSLTIFIMPFLYACHTSHFVPNQKLINVDAGKLTEWDVTPLAGNKEKYKVVKTQEGWKVMFPNGSTVAASPDYIDRSLRHLIDLRADSIAATSKDKWNALGVGDSGTEIKIYQQGQAPIAVIVGKLDFMNTSKANYYVRIPGDNNVYVVRKYLEGSFAASAENMRGRMMVPLPPEQILELHFASASGNQWALTFQDGQWMVDGKPANQVQASRYISMIANLQVRQYTDRPSNGADYSIIIVPTQGESVSIKIYKKDNGQYVLESSANKGNYLALDTDAFTRIFPDKSGFLLSSGDKK